MIRKFTPTNEASRFHGGPARAKRPLRPPLVQSHWTHLIIALASLFPGAVHAASLVSTNLPPMLPPPLPDAGFSIIRVFGALTLVVALFLAGVWLYKNWHRVGVNRGRQQQLQILESRSLGGRHALYVVGYQGQRLLLAASPSGVSLISHLPVADIEPDAATDKTGNQQFVHALQQALQQKA